MFRLDRRSQRDLRQLADDLQKFDRLVEHECPEEFRDVADSVANEARLRAPYASGRLRDSIDRTMVAGAPAVSVGVPYAAIQDQGGRHPVFGRGSVVQRPTHFLTNAVQSHEMDLMRAADQAVSAAARRIGF